MLVAASLCSATASAQDPLADPAQASPPPSTLNRTDSGRTLSGGVGLLNVRSATILPMTLAVSAHGGFFRQDAFATTADEVEYRASSIGASFAPTDWLEVSLATRSATYDRMDDQVRYTKTNDLQLALKGGTFVADGLLGLAVELGARLPPGSEPQLASSAISPGVQAIVTANLETVGAPVQVHLNTGVLLDRSLALEEGATSPLGRRYALGINPYTQWATALGVEGRFAVSNIILRPFVEYAVDVPLGAASGFSAAPMTLTPGLRVLPWRGLSIDLGVQLGVAGGLADGIAPVPGLMGMVGVGYHVGLDGARQTVVERVVRIEKEAEPVALVPTTGELSGLVVDASGQPLPRAVVVLPERNSLLTDDKGAFRVRYVPAGKLTVRAEQTGYAPADASTTVTAGGKVEVKLTLAALPPPPVEPVTLKGSVLDEKGNPIDAEVGASSAGLSPEAVKGEFNLKLPAGDAQVEASSKGYLTQARRISGRPGETIIADFVLKKAPSRKLVVLKKEKIEIKKQVLFATNRDVILPGSFGLLDEVAAMIIENPQLKKIRVEGHTDDQGDDTYNLDLSQRRASSVQRALLERGVSRDRLDSVGFGESQPIADNKKSFGRAKNRRVEFMIVDGADQTATDAP